MKYSILFLINSRLFKVWKAAFMFDYYFATIFFSVFIMIVLKVMVYYNEFLEKDQKKRLDLLAGLVILTSLAEWSGVQLDGAALWTRPFHIAVKVVELSLAPAIPFLCADVIQDKRHPLILDFFLGTQALLEVLSQFFKGIFYVNAENIYFHGPLYVIYVVAFLSGILFFIWVVLKACRQQYGIRRIILLFLPFFAICGLIFQYTGQKPRVIWLCTSIDILLMYILYVELTMNTDALTHLLNRQCYESRISRMRDPANIFYFDVDDFKGINDTYGHAYGDLTLSTAAECIQEVFGNSGYCYRIGGDEFCAILPGLLSDPRKYVEQFTHTVELQQEKDLRFPYISIGYAQFDPVTDRIANVVKEADSSMYRRKRASKESRQKTR